MHAVAVTPDGRQAVSGCEDGTLKLWDLGADEEAVVAATMLSDSPLSRPEPSDRLGFTPYGAVLFQLITRSDTSLPLSMAVSVPPRTSRLSSGVAVIPLTTPPVGVCLVGPGFDRGGCSASEVS